MPNITRPSVEIISVDQFHALVEKARAEKIDVGMELAKTELAAPDLGRGLKTPIFITDGDADLKILHPEEAATVTALDKEKPDE